MTNISNQHITLKSVTVIFLDQTIGNNVDKTTLITLCADKLFLAATVAEELIQTNSRINSQLCCFILTGIHHSLKSAINNVFQSAESCIRLTCGSISSHICKMNRDDIQTSIIGCNLNFATDKLSSRVLGIRTRLLNLQSMFV